MPLGSRPMTLGKRNSVLVSAPPRPQDRTLASNDVFSFLTLARARARAPARACTHAHVCSRARVRERDRARAPARIGRSRALEGARGRSRALKQLERAARQRCSPPELVSLGAPPLRSGSRSCTRSRARSHAHARGSAVVLVRRRSRALEGTRGRSSARALERATAVLLTRASSDGGPTPTLGPPLALPHALARVRACGSAIVPARRRARALEGARGRSRALESARGRSRSARPGHATVQNTTTGGVNPGLLINYFRRKFSPNDGKSPPKRHKTAIYAPAALVG